MVSQCFLWASRRDPLWQYSLCLGAIMMVWLMFIGWMSIETLVLHYSIPSLVETKVRDMRLSLMRMIRDLFVDPTEGEEEREEENGDPHKTPPRAGQQGKDKGKTPPSKRRSFAHVHARAHGYVHAVGGTPLFSSSDHFFVAGKIAPLVVAEPELRLEAALILSHRDTTPGPLRAKWLNESEAERLHAFSSMPDGKAKNRALLSSGHGAGPHKNKVAPLTDRALQHISPRFLTTVDIMHIANRRLALHPTLGGGKDRRAPAAKRFVRKQRFRLYMAKYAATLWFRVEKLGLAFGMLPDLARILCLRALQPIIVTMVAYLTLFLLDAPQEVQIVIGAFAVLIILAIVTWWHYSAAEEARRKNQVLPELNDSEDEDEDEEPAHEVHAASLRTPGFLGTPGSGAVPGGSTTGFVNGMQEGEDVDEYLSDLGSIDEVSTSSSSGSGSSSSDAHDVAKRVREAASGKSKSSHSGIMDSSTSSGSSVPTDELDVSESSDSNPSEISDDEEDEDNDKGGVAAQAISTVKRARSRSSHQSSASSSEFSLGQSVDGDGNYNINIRHGRAKDSDSARAGHHSDHDGKSGGASSSSEEDLLDALYGDGNGDKDKDDAGDSSGISSEEERVLGHHYRKRDGEEEEEEGAAPAAAKAQSRWRKASAAAAFLGAATKEQEQEKPKKAKLTHQDIVNAAMQPFEYTRPSPSPPKGKAIIEGRFVPKRSPGVPLGGDKHNDDVSSDSDGETNAPLLFQHGVAAEGLPASLIDLKTLRYSVEEKNGNKVNVNKSAASSGDEAAYESVEEVDECDKRIQETMASLQDNHTNKPPRFMQPRQPIGAPGAGGGLRELVGSHRQV